MEFRIGGLRMAGLRIVECESSGVRKGKQAVVCMHAILSGGRMGVVLFAVH